MPNISPEEIADEIAQAMKNVLDTYRVSGYIVVLLQDSEDKQPVPGVVLAACRQCASVPVVSTIETLTTHLTDYFNSVHEGSENAEKCNVQIEWDN